METPEDSGTAVGKHLLKKLNSREINKVNLMFKAKESRDCSGFRTVVHDNVVTQSKVQFEDRSPVRFQDVLRTSPAKVVHHQTLVVQPELRSKITNPFSFKNQRLSHALQNQESLQALHELKMKKKREFVIQKQPGSKRNQQVPEVGQPRKSLNPSVIGTLQGSRAPIIDVKGEARKITRLRYLQNKIDLIETLEQRDSVGPHTSIMSNRTSPKSGLSNEHAVITMVSPKANFNFNGSMNIHKIEPSNLDPKQLKFQKIEYQKKMNQSNAAAKRLSQPTMQQESQVEQLPVHEGSGGLHNLINTEEMKSGSEMNTNENAHKVSQDILNKQTESLPTNESQLIFLKQSSKYLKQARPALQPFSAKREQGEQENTDLAEINAAIETRGFGPEVMSSVTSQKSVIKGRNLESLQVFDIKNIQITEKQQSPAQRISQKVYVKGDRAPSDLGGNNMNGRTLHLNQLSHKSLMKQDDPASRRCSQSALSDNEIKKNLQERKSVLMITQNESHNNRNALTLKNQSHSLDSDNDRSPELAANKITKGGSTLANSNEKGHLIMDPCIEMKILKSPRNQPIVANSNAALFNFTMPNVKFAGQTGKIPGHQGGEYTRRIADHTQNSLNEWGGNDVGQQSFTLERYQMPEVAQRQISPERTKAAQRNVQLKRQSPDDQILIQNQKNFDNQLGIPEYDIIKDLQNNPAPTPGTEMAIKANAYQMNKQHNSRGSQISQHSQEFIIIGIPQEVASFSRRAAQIAHQLKNQNRSYKYQRLEVTGLAGLAQPMAITGVTLSPMNKTQQDGFTGKIQNQDIYNTLNAMKSGKRAGSKSPHGKEPAFRKDVNISVQNFEGIDPTYSQYSIRQQQMEMQKRYEGPVIYQNPLAPSKQGAIARSKLDASALSHNKKTYINVNPNTGPTSGSEHHNEFAPNNAVRLGFESQNSSPAQNRFIYPAQSNKAIAGKAASLSNNPRQLEKIYGKKIYPPPQQTPILMGKDLNMFATITPQDRAADSPELISPTNVMHTQTGSLTQLDVQHSKSPRGLQAKVRASANASADKLECNSRYQDANNESEQSQIGNVQINTLQKTNQYTTTGTDLDEMHHELKAGQSFGEEAVQRRSRAPRIDLYRVNKTINNMPNNSFRQDDSQLQTTNTIKGKRQSKVSTLGRSYQSYVKPHDLMGSRGSSRHSGNQSSNQTNFEALLRSHSPRLSNTLELIEKERMRHNQLLQKLKLSQFSSLLPKIHEDDPAANDNLKEALTEQDLLTIFNRSKQAFNPQEIPPISIWRQPHVPNLQSTQMNVSRFSDTRMSRIEKLLNKPMDLRQLTDFNVDHNLSRDKIKLQRFQVKRNQMKQLRNEELNSTPQPTVMDVDGYQEKHKSDAKSRQGLYLAQYGSKEELVMKSWRDILDEVDYRKMQLNQSVDIKEVCQLLNMQQAGDNNYRGSFMSQSRQERFDRQQFYNSIDFTKVSKLELARRGFPVPEEHCSNARTSFYQDPGSPRSLAQFREQSKSILDQRTQLNLLDESIPQYQQPIKHLVLVADSTSKSLFDEDVDVPASDQRKHSLQPRKKLNQQIPKRVDRHKNFSHMLEKARVSNPLGNSLIIQNKLQDLMPSSGPKRQYLNTLQHSKMLLPGIERGANKMAKLMDNIQANRPNQKVMNAGQTVHDVQRIEQQRINQIASVIEKVKMQQLAAENISADAHKMGISASADTNNIYVQSSINLINKGSEMLETLPELMKEPQLRTVTKKEILLEEQSKEQERTSEQPESPNTNSRLQAVIKSQFPSAINSKQHSSLVVGIPISSPRNTITRPKIVTKSELIPKEVSEENEDLDQNQINPTKPVY